MKLRLNNSELVAILKVIEHNLDYNEDLMSLTSLLSFVKKVNDNATTYTRNPEELAIELKTQIIECIELEEAD